MKRKWVRRPLVQLDARGQVATHGPQTPRVGVWHTTESHDHAGVRDLQGIVDFWKRQGKGLGAHVIIDAHGNSALCANFNQVCYAVAKNNTGKIQFELVGFARFTPKLWWLRVRQLNKLAKWMAYINKEYGIPLEEQVSFGWAGHKDFPNQSHTDPGKWFPRKYVLRKAAEFRKNGWT